MINAFKVLIIFLGIILPTLTSAAGDDRNFPLGTQEVYIADSSNIRHEALENIQYIVNKSIKTGKYPGTVIVASHKGETIYKGVFGSQSILPKIVPMRFNTIFDLASLTKVVVTTPLIMQLLEEGKLELDEKVKYYWPEFTGGEKENITIRHLLTHTSGLPASLPQSQLMWQGKDHGLELVKQVSIVNPVASKFVYSDVGYITLAYVAELITGKNLDELAKERIFGPLKMDNSWFLPLSHLKDRIAPTEIIDGVLRHGQVHDPTAFAMGGVIGSAGLFGTAADLSIYANSLLNGGRIPNSWPNNYKFFLSPLSVLKMTTAQTPLNLEGIRGLGFDIDSNFSNRGVLLSSKSYGHTGWTGTSIWIDPDTETWIIILTSRTHPKRFDVPVDELNNATQGLKTAINPLIIERRLIANIIATSLIINTKNLNNTGVGELNRAYTISGS